MKISEMVEALDRRIKWMEEDPYGPGEAHVDRAIRTTLLKLEEWQKESSVCLGLLSLDVSLSDFNKIAGLNDVQIPSRHWKTPEEITKLLAQIRDFGEKEK